VEFRVLGPIEVQHSDERIELPGARPQALLAAGLLDANRILTVPRLVDVVWGDEPPASAPGLVHTYIWALRRALHRPNEPKIIITRPPGYLVQVEPDQLDLHRFESLVSAGRAAATEGREVEAAEKLRAALALWRGPALAGFDTPVLRAEATRLEEMRLAVVEERVAVDLRLGRLGALVVELTGLVSTYPLREHLRAELMRTLYRLGRQSDALDVYRQGVEVIRAELGLDPGPELRKTQQEILSGERAVAGPRQAPEAVAAGVVRTQASAAGAGLVPAQLPPAINDLIGRDLVVEELRGLLLSAADADRSAVCAIAGKAGSGKTALALRVAHLVRSAFPDGQLFVDLRGTNHAAAATPWEVAGVFLRAFGVDPGRIPEPVDERVALLRSTVAGRRVLFLLDNAASPAQVRPLLATQRGCAVLITSRTPLTGLDGHAHLELDVLGEDDARHLLARLAGAERVAAEPDAAAEIARLCGGLPLAVRAVGARLAARRHWPLSVLAGRLQDEHRRLDELTAGDLEVRASLELSYRAVAEPERLAFRRLGALGVPDFSPWLLVPLMNVPLADVERIADRLADAQLLDHAGMECYGHVRYRMHDLIRIYAGERDRAEETTNDRRDAIRRTLDCLLALTQGVWAGTASGEVRAWAAADGDRFRLPADLADQLLANPTIWLNAERQTLVASVQRGTEVGLHGPACELAAVLLSSRRIQDYFDEWYRVHSAALAGARVAGHRSGEAVLELGLGQLRYSQDRLTEAVTHYERARSIFRQTGDRRREANCLVPLAAIHAEQGEFRQAQRLLDPAIEICTELDDDDGLAEAMYRLGYIHRELGEFPESLNCTSQAVALYRKSGSRRGEGLALRAVGLHYRATGELDAAEQAATEAVEVFKISGDRLLTAYGEQALAKVYLRQGHHAAAGNLLRECLSVCEALEDAFGIALVLRTIGELHLAEGDLDAAVRRFDASIAGWEELRLPLFAARTRRDLADAYERQGDHDTARTVRDLAMRAFRAFGSREYHELCWARTR
jgi:DNA-binding SARP family transcriptional activator/tetratricopeptide (TPR) repeat protein